MNNIKINEDFFNGTNENIQDMPVSYFLDKNEKILWKGRPKKSAYILGKTLSLMPIALLWLAFDVTFIAVILSNFHSIAILFVIIPFFALHLTPFWKWLYDVLKASKEQKTIEYLITNFRIIVFKGNPKYIDTSMSLNELGDSSLKINFVDKLLGVGDITIKSVDGSEIFISDIPNSEFLHSKILTICKNPAVAEEFYDDKVECVYCDTIYDAKEKRCPSCGSARKDN